MRVGGRHAALVTVAALVSFGANWQFGFQITYVNTAVRTFYLLADKAFRAEHNCSTTTQDDESDESGCHLTRRAFTRQWSVVVSAFYAGSLVGFAITPLVVARLGVKKAMLWMCAFAVCGCAIHFSVPLVISRGLAAFALMLTVGRVLVGVMAGAALCLLPLYIQEISPSSMRNFLHSLQQMSQALCTLLGLLVGSESIIPWSENRFLWLQMIAIAPTLIFIVTLLVTPQTPVHLYRHGADFLTIVQSLNFYHSDTADFLETHGDYADPGSDSSYSKDSSSSSSSSLSITSIPWSSWKGCLVGSLAALSYTFTADDLIDTFSADFIHNAGDLPSEGYDRVRDIEADRLSIFFGVVLVLASAVGLWTADRFGRRPLLIGGLLATACSNSVVVLCAGHASWTIALGFGLTKVFIGLGAGAPGWFLTSELVSPAHASLLQSLSTGLLLLSTMLTSAVYLELEWLLGSGALLVLAVVPALVCALLLFLFMPETRHRPRAEIRRLLREQIFSGLVGLGLGLTGNEGDDDAYLSSSSLVPSPLHETGSTTSGVTACSSKGYGSLNVN